MITVLTVLWIVVALAASAVWLYGILAGYREDDTVHLGAGEESEIDKQVRNDVRMKKIERWRTALSLSTVVGGVVVLGVYIYAGLSS